jgi:hypothetical protein
MIHDHIFHCLSTDTAVANLCAKRIYPNLAKQGVDQAHIVYQQITAPVEYYSTGKANGRQTITMDLRCFGPQGFASPRYQQAHTVAQAARRALEAVRNQRLGTSMLLGAEIQNTTDLYDEKAKWHYVVLSAQLFYCSES